MTLFHVGHLYKEPKQKLIARFLTDVAVPQQSLLQLDAFALVRSDLLDHASILVPQVTRLGGGGRGTTGAAFGR